jgi:hypothetical protein
VPNGYCSVAVPFEPVGNLHGSREEGMLDMLYEKSSMCHLPVGKHG